MSKILFSSKRSLSIYDSFKSALKALSKSSLFVSSNKYPFTSASANVLLALASISVLISPKTLSAVITVSVSKGVGTGLIRPILACTFAVLTSSIVTLYKPSFIQTKK